jgi:hypothetical protein
MTNTNRPTITDLMANETPGGRGLLAYEILRNDTRGDRSHGPLDSTCEACGYEWNGDFLLDTATCRWECKPCSIESFFASRPAIDPSMLDTAA